MADRPCSLCGGTVRLDNLACASCWQEQLAAVARIEREAELAAQDAALARFEEATTDWPWCVWKGQLRPRHEPGTGWVYWLRMPDGTIKIGSTERHTGPRERARQQHGRLLYVQYGTDPRSRERAYHRRFAHLRARRERFEHRDELADFLARARA
jgi:hypothetical protein